MQRLPITEYEFTTLREGNYFYIDKTEYAWRLANGSSPVFLSRPRRFGKSMLISTLEAYFQGRRALFEGLKIEALEAEKGEEAWREYPVIRLDFNGLYASTVERAVEGLNEMLRPYEALYPSRYSGDPSSRFKQLLATAYEQKGPVVLLIDEYDKPLYPLLRAGKREVHDDVADLLRAFYSNIKGSMRYLRFAMLTGVSQYSNIHLASDLNNLYNITWDDAYSGICGVTEEELREYLHPAVVEMAEQLGMGVDGCYAGLKHYYDGYTFTRRGAHVYNPYSIINALQAKEFDNFWFKSSTSKVLSLLLPNTYYDFKRLEGEVEAPKLSLERFEPLSDDPIPMLYQYGYLTLVGYDREFDLCTLRMPNEEVRLSFWNGLLPWLATMDAGQDGALLSRQIWRALKRGRIEEMVKLIISTISGASYPSHLTERLSYEDRYRDLLYLLFLAAGADVRCEVQGDEGRSDVEVELEDAVYIFELKVEHDRPVSPDDALAQIDRKAYALKHAWKGKRLVGVGIVFRKKDKKAGSWRVVELG